MSSSMGICEAVRWWLMKENGLPRPGVRFS